MSMTSRRDVAGGLLSVLMAGMGRPSQPDAHHSLDRGDVTFPRIGANQ
ncbi:MAG: hypothetical protein WA418_30685 [Bradyrhizobium sp.]